MSQRNGHDCAKAGAASAALPRIRCRRCGRILFWLLVARASVAQALPFAKGVRLGLYTTLVSLLLVWPGLILAICNFAIRSALVLVGLAAAIYAAIHLAYLPRPSGPVSLLLAALLVVMLGSFWLFVRAARPPWSPISST